MVVCVEFALDQRLLQFQVLEISSVSIHMTYAEYAQMDQMLSIAPVVIPYA